MIKILKIAITDEIETTIEVTDNKMLEKVRKEMIENYQIEGQKPFHIDFTLSSDNFNDVYLKHKKA